MSAYMIVLAKPDGSDKKLWGATFMDIAFEKYDSIIRRFEDVSVMEFKEVHNYDMYTILIDNDTLESVAHVWVAFPESGEEYNIFIKGCDLVNEGLEQR